MSTDQLSGDISCEEACQGDCCEGGAECFTEACFLAITQTMCTEMESECAQSPVCLSSECGCAAITGFVCCSSGGGSCNILPTLISFFITLIVSVTSVIVLGLFQSFNPIGPLQFGIFCSCFLVFGLSGVHFDSYEQQNSCRKVKRNISESIGTKIGKISIIHSHHKPELRENGHEIKIGHRFFCTGCYGLLIGTCISIILMSHYLLTNSLIIQYSYSLSLAALCFIPIIIKYTIIRNMIPPLRLLSNILLPIGLCLFSIFVDYTYHDWLLNVSLIIVVLIAVYIRSGVAIIDNSNQTIKLYE